MCAEVREVRGEGGRGRSYCRTGYNLFIFDRGEEAALGGRGYEALYSCLKLLGG
jgi:hypothetical protein